MKKFLINTKYKNFGGEDANILDELKFLRVIMKLIILNTITVQK